MIYRTRHSTLVTRATRATGLDTLTTFSVNRPRTVTFEGPISPQPPGSMATTVSGVYRDRLASDPLCNPSQPPCPVSSVPPWHRPSVPVTDCDSREGAMLSHSETPVQFQPGNNTVASRAQCRSENTVYPTHKLYGKWVLLCGGGVSQLGVVGPVPTNGITICKVALGRDRGTASIVRTCSTHLPTTHCLSHKAPLFCYPHL